MIFRFSVGIHFTLCNIQFIDNLFLGGSLANAFCHHSGTLMFLVLMGLFSIEKPSNIGSSWTHVFLGGASSLSICSLLSDNCGSLDVLQSHDFGVISDNLLCADVDYISVYMDRLLSGLETLNIKTGAAVFFEDISMGLGVEVSGLMSSTIIELQAIALALECVLSFQSVDLFLNSQAALDAYKLELKLAHPDFRN
ncbi:hypothetical protein G9A89_005750 [Geosiphon pyriformis]|nr:hypothetical protein G9A89_005750 [Geosiphon pyriformis]